MTEHWPTAAADDDVYFVPFQKQLLKQQGWLSIPFMEGISLLKLTRQLSPRHYALQSSGPRAPRASRPTATGSTA